jgi:uncharacterized protein (DUF2164 family)
MSKPIGFTREERQDLVERLRAWSREALDEPLTNLQAEMLLDVIAEHAAPAIYNRALYDAQAVVSARAEEMAEAILTLERS